MYSPFFILIGKKAAFIISDINLNEQLERDGELEPEMRGEGIHEEDGKIDIEEDFDYEVIFYTKMHIQHFPPVYD